mgnify:CR=1 FL=1
MNDNSFLTSLIERITNFFKESNFLKDIIVPIHSAGYPFIIIFFILALIIGSFSDFLGMVGLILTAWCVYFFRDPERVHPSKKKLIISPADGKILPLNIESPPKETNLKEKMKKISIFMNVFNVHVNRIPFDGKISLLHYEPGSFFNASLDKASKNNERMTVVIEIEGGLKIVLVQIAGLIARRIKCDLKKDQSVKAGEKFGIIRFGSRVDVYLPQSLTINVLEGQTSIGGETVISEYSSPSKSNTTKQNIKK